MLRVDAFNSQHMKATMKLERNGRSVTEAGAMASFAKGKSTVVRSVDGDAGILIARAGKYGFGSRTALSLAR